jgi:hypothetical protein
VNRVVIGMDPHKRSVTIAVMAPNETVLGGGRYATDPVGYAAMLRDARQWADRAWAVEGCSGIGRHVATRLLADGEQVVDVPPKLSARARVFSTMTSPGAIMLRPTRRTRRRLPDREAIALAVPACCSLADYVRTGAHGLRTERRSKGISGTSRPVSRVLFPGRSPGDGHPSRITVASDLVRSTPELGRAALERSGRSPKAPSRPCSRWGLPSRPGHPGRWCALTAPFHPYLPRSRRSAFCGTFPRVTPGRCYRPPCPVEPGLSSAPGWCRDRPADSSR